MDLIKKPELVALRELMAGVTRRRFLRRVGTTSAAAGLLAAGVTSQSGETAVVLAADAQALPKKCLQMRVFAKHARVAPKFTFDVICDDCTCGQEKVTEARFRLEMILSSLECDETENIVPNNSRLRLDMLRRYTGGPCESPVGVHQARWTIVDPAGAPLFAKGSMTGTDGLKPDFQCEGNGCCNPRHDEGCMVGRGVQKLKGCSLTATYSSRVDSDEFDVCDEKTWAAYTLDIMGLLQCACGTAASG